MTDLTIPDFLAEQIQTIAEREHRSIPDVLASMVAQYAPEEQADDAQVEALHVMLGMFDDDVTDLSSTIRETMNTFWAEKNADSD